MKQPGRLFYIYAPLVRLYIYSNHRIRQDSECLLPCSTTGLKGNKGKGRREKGEVKFGGVVVEFCKRIHTGIFLEYMLDTLPGPVLR